ncbi:hypothetical protein PoMZ_04218 [Pyricularia oryzae]|uniref:Uncharacterized protein n=1 Tax=Pyricularia oryzae TaxID=318829 RepID=A0A4P7N944_PYROR|nr:hypothetical protein PoMZ_04218 [Pyricularia oryzae]
MSACHIQGMEGNQTPGYCGQAGLMLPVHAWAMETGSWLEKKHEATTHQRRWRVVRKAPGRSNCRQG